MSTVHWKGKHFEIRQVGQGPYLLTRKSGIVLERFDDLDYAEAYAQYCDTMGGFYTGFMCREAKRIAERARIVYDNPAADQMYAPHDRMLTVDEAAMLCDVDHSRIATAYLAGKLNPAPEPRRHGHLFFMHSELMRALHEGVFNG